MMATLPKFWIDYDFFFAPQFLSIEHVSSVLQEGGYTQEQAQKIVLAEVLERMDGADSRMMPVVLSYLRSGQQVFVVGPHLQEMFYNTGLSNVKREHLSVPFQAFYVALSECERRMWSARNGWGPCGGFYVDASDPDLWFLAPAGRCPGSPEALVHNLAWIPLDWLEMGDDDLERWLAKKFAEGREVYHKGQIPDSVAAEIWETHVHCLRVLVNLLLYLGSHGHETVPDPDYEAAARRRAEIDVAVARTGKAKKIRHLLKEQKELSNATVTWLGPSIERAAIEEAVWESGRKVRRHWVRGHWRVPARKDGERIVRWIQPYERGHEEAGHVEKHLYKIRDTVLPKGESSS